MMEFVLVVFGLYMVAAGILVWWKPALITRKIEWVLRQSSRRGLSVVVVGIGLTLLWAVPVTIEPVFIQVLAWLAILKGVLLAVAPTRMIDGLMDQWQELARGLQIVWGLLSVGCGVFVLTSL